MQPHPDEYFNREVCKPFFHHGSDHGVLLLHGFTGSCAHMRKLANALAERGYTVRTVNLPGHATSEADMARTDWQQWLHAAKEAAYEMMRETRVFTVGGLSMGGVLSLLIAQQMKPDGCVTLSAPTSVQNPLLPLAGALAPFKPRVAWRTHEERGQKLDSAYDFGYSGFPTAKGADLYRLIRLARQNLFNVSCPILCVQSEADETISRSSADTILSGVGSELRQKLWLKEAPHVCTLSSELPSIIEAMDAFLKRVQEEKHT